MDIWQRNIRLMHYIDEFLDLDSANSNVISDFISLIDAIREGLEQIDEEFRMPDAQINILFLTKLKSRPDWTDWATAMLRDPRLNALDPGGRMTFQDLGNLALERERELAGEREREKERESEAEINPGNGNPTNNGSEGKKTRHTQDEINAFVMRKMSQDGRGSRRGGGHGRGHLKRPSQEEINEYVVEQMRREQDRKTRARSQSQPVPRSQDDGDAPFGRRRCGFCGDPSHAVDHCWRRWRVAVEEPRANFAPKRVEFRSEIPGYPPIYRTGFFIN